MRIGFLEPHLEPAGGIRRVLETANELVRRGHRVTIYVPGDVRRRCHWMPCLASIAHVADGSRDELDVLLFNDEPQWYLLERFPRARRRVFFALGHGGSYGKRGSWEAVRAPVDAILANSTWTARRIEDETGRRPAVVPTGLDHSQFKPLPLARRYPVLCAGDPRPWKGTDLIEAACGELGVPLASIHDIAPPQSQLAREYARAEVFVVGSSVEGFGLTGLEAMACGAALVTTDAGGCREYAHHGETALVVPPGDPRAMAEAIRTVRSDRSLRERLVAQALELTAAWPSWSEAALSLEERLRDIVAQRSVRPRRQPAARPPLSVVVSGESGLSATQACVESIRRCGEARYQLVIADAGREVELRRYAAQASDAWRPGGLSRAAAAAAGDWILICDDAFRMTPGWAATAQAVLHAGAAVGVILLREGPDPPAAEEVPALARMPLGAAVCARRDVVYASAPVIGGYRERSGRAAELALEAWRSGVQVVSVTSGGIVNVGASSVADTAARLDSDRSLLIQRWAHRHPPELLAAILPQPARVIGSPPGLALRAVRGPWRLARPLVPHAARAWLYRRLRSAHERAFPERAVRRKIEIDPPDHETEGYAHDLTANPAPGRSDRTL